MVPEPKRFLEDRLPARSSANQSYSVPWKSSIGCLSPSLQPWHLICFGGGRDSSN